MQAPLQLPGYSWDPVTRRFFKQVHNPAKHTPASSARSTSARQLDRTAKDQDESASRRRKRARKTRDKGKWRAVEPQGVAALRSLDLGRSDSRAQRDSLQQCVRLLHRLETISLTLAPAAVSSAHQASRACRRPAPSSPTASPWTTRSSTSRSTTRTAPHSASAPRAASSRASPLSLALTFPASTVALTPDPLPLARSTGYLARPPDELANYPNDEESWRTSWYCSSKITSLKTCGDRIVCVPRPASLLFSIHAR